MLLARKRNVWNRLYKEEPHEVQKKLRMLEVQRGASPWPFHTPFNNAQDRISQMFIVRT